MPCPPQVPISVIPPVSQGIGPILWQNGNQVTRLNIPLNPSWLVYDGTTTRWGDGSSASPVYLPNIEEYTTLPYIVGVTSSGQIAKTQLGSTSVASNVSGGTPGALLYQSDPSITTNLPIGTTGQVLVVNGFGNAPSWVNQSTLSVGSATNASSVPYSGLTGSVPIWNQDTTGNAATATTATTATSATTATTATNLAGGNAGEIVYQSGVSATTFLSQGTAGQVLSCNGSGGLGWITNSTTSSSTNNINGGAAGEVVYQTGVNTTGFTGVGTTGQVLVSNGAGAPAWSTNISGNAATASSVPYSGLTGTVPTWNQNTTGNAATASSVPYSGLTGAVPTWNQNTTGNAATATTAVTATTATTANGVAAGSVTPAGLSAAVGANAWLSKTSTYTALAGDRIAASTTGGTWTLTLPTSPATNSMVTIADAGNYWATNNLTVAPGGSNTIQGVAQNLICNVSSYSIYLLYDGSTWRVLV